MTDPGLHTQRLGAPPTRWRTGWRGGLLGGSLGLAVSALVCALPDWVWQ
jgi:hypothetical protein